MRHIVRGLVSSDGQHDSYSGPRQTSLATPIWHLYARLASVSTVGRGTPPVHCGPIRRAKQDCIRRVPQRPLLLAGSAAGTVAVSCV